MQLQRLRPTSCLPISREATQHWLWLAWRGELTRPAGQDAGVAVAECCRPHAYGRVLSNYLPVTQLPGQVATWVSVEFWPYLAVVGVEQVAWLRAPAVASCPLALATRQRVPSWALNWFATGEQALPWRQPPAVPQPESSCGPPPTHGRLAQGVDILRQEVPQVPHNVRRWPLQAWRS